MIRVDMMVAWTLSAIGNTKFTEKMFLRTVESFTEAFCL